MGFKLADALVWISGNTKPLEDDLDHSEKKTKSWAGGLAGNVSKLLGGALVAGVGAVATGVVAVGASAVQTSNQLRNAAGDIEAQLGVTGDRARELADVTKGIFANNFGASVEDANAALITTAQNMERLGEVSDAVLQESTENAFRLQDAFGIDISESTAAVTTLMEKFGLSSQEAFDLVTHGVQNGLNSSGDFLDTIGEYSGLFADAGATADEFYSVLASGQQGGALGTDKIADAFKEFQIRFLEGSDEMAGAVEQLTGESWGTFVEEIQNGDRTVADTFGLFTQLLGDIEDPIERNRLAIELMGTQAEDLGSSFAEGIDMGLASLEDMAGSTEKLDAQYQDFGSMFSGLWRRSLVALTPLTDKMLEMANDMMPHVEAAFTSFEENVIPAIENALGWIGSLFDGTNEEFEEIKALFTENSIPAALQELFGRAVDWASEKFDQLWPLVSEKLTDMFNSAVTWVQETDWAEVGRKTVELIIGAFELWAKVHLLLMDFYQAAWDWFTEQDWAALGQGILDAITGVLSGIWEMVEPILTQWWTDVTVWFGEQVQAAKQLGTDIINGIKEGVRSAAANLWEEAKSVVLGALQAAKDAIWSRSPSKKAAEMIGEPLVQGVEQPLLAGRQRIATAMSRMVDIFPSRPVPAGMGAGGSGLVINVDARGATDPLSVREMARRGAEEALKAAGIRTDALRRIR